MSKILILTSLKFMLFIHLKIALKTLVLNQEHALCDLIPTFETQMY